MSAAETPNTPESRDRDHVDGDDLLAYLARITADVERAAARVELLVGLREQDGYGPEVAVARRPLRPLRRALVDLAALSDDLKQYIRAARIAFVEPTLIAVDNLMPDPTPGEAKT